MDVVKGGEAEVKGRLGLVTIRIIYYGYMSLASPSSPKVHLSHERTRHTCVESPQTFSPERLLHAVDGALVQHALTARRAGRLGLKSDL